MIKLSDIQTTVHYDKPRPDYTTVIAHLEVHGVATVREKDPARRAKMTEDAKHLATRQVWRKIYDMGDVYGYLADLEYIALINTRTDGDKIRELGNKIRAALEGRE